MPAVAVRTLGTFAVFRGELLVPRFAWQSKKARDLLKILVCARGRPVARGALTELLWPGADPRRTANRLSVALTTLRNVLDPGRRRPPGRFVDADRFHARLDLEHVDVDVERFLDDARRGLARVRTADHDDAVARLRRADAAYVGDFLEEDVYEDWSFALREEARAAHVAVAGALAGLADARGDHDEAVVHRLHALAGDPFGERAHQALVDSLVAAGRHGDARRARVRHAGRMAELGAEPAAASGAPLRRA